MMNDLFFYLSKLAWIFISPTNVIVILVLLAALCFVIGHGWRTVGRYCVYLCALLILLTGILPLGDMALRALENRFPAKAALSQPVDGIIVLGGSFNQELSYDRKQISVNDNIERIFAFIDLMKRYPNAKAVFTGGNSKIVPTEGVSEAGYAKDLLTVLGVKTRDIIFEDKSRNTHENAVFSKKLARPQPGEKWVLVTSAFHMPRSVGIFRKQGWDVIAYPVDYHTNREWALADRNLLHMFSNISKASTAFREYVGLLAYYLTGKTSALFPEPKDNL